MGDIKYFIIKCELKIWRPVEILIDLFVFSFIDSIAHCVSQIGHILELFFAFVSAGVTVCTTPAC